MRIAVLADVHANLPALEAVVRDLQDLGCDHLWHLGDAVGYGAEPYACIQILADLGAEMIAGNHELAIVDPEMAAGFNPAAREAVDWTRQALSAEIIRLLAELPRALQPEAGIHLFHGLPNNVNGYIRTSETAEQVLSYFTDRYPLMRLAFFGHTHRSAVFTQLTGRPLRTFEPDREILISSGRRYLINPGSVGQPRNNDPRTQYLVFDPDQGRIRFRKIEYDVQAAQARILEAHLPPPLAARLSQGL